VSLSAEGGNPTLLVRQSLDEGGFATYFTSKQHFRVAEIQNIACETSLRLVKLAGIIGCISSGDKKIPAFTGKQHFRVAEIQEIAFETSIRLVSLAGILMSHFRRDEYPQNEPLTFFASVEVDFYHWVGHIPRASDKSSASSSYSLNRNQLCRRQLHQS
jgi:hypothetical protein